MRSEGPGSDGWLDALPQAVVLHRAGVVVRLNEAAERLWGVPDARARGRSLLEVVRRHTLEELAERGGTLELEVAGRTMVCRGVRGALIAEDVTELRRREASLREAMAVLSHEFRTPVTALRGLLEALEYELPREMQRNFVGQALAEVERLTRLVEDVTSGSGGVRARTVEFSGLLERARQLLREPLDAAGVRVELLGSAVVRVDPDKLLQVLLNLLENALRYGPRPGTVRVELTPKAGTIEVAVIDEGPALADVHSIWGAHVRGPNATGKGSGMGLYIVRSIVEGWGGRAWAAPAEGAGGGNAFRFTVPGA